jgi:hypothetical protein
MHGGVRRFFFGGPSALGGLCHWGAGTFQVVSKQRAKSGAGLYRRSQSQSAAARVPCVYVAYVVCIWCMVYGVYMCDICMLYMPARVVYIATLVHGTTHYSDYSLLQP